MSIKVLYLDDASGARKETFVYQTSEYVTTATASSPIITLPSGKLDPSLLPSAANDKAARIVVDRTAQLDVVTGDLVRAIGTAKVQPADADTAVADATVLGLALNDALVGENVEVQVLGIISDAAYNVFLVNTPLFLDLDGGITDDRPEQPGRKFLTNVGKSLGNGEILIQVDIPIELGV
jgi:hypothetical protein